MLLSIYARRGGPTNDFVPVVQLARRKRASEKMKQCRVMPSTDKAFGEGSLGCVVAICWLPVEDAVKRLGMRPLPEQRWDRYSVGTNYMMFFRGPN